MGREKIHISHDVPPAVKTAFDELCAVMSCKKWQVLETMIRAFVAMPQSIQDDLISKRPGVQEEALRKLAQIGTLDSAVDALEQDAKKRRRRTSQKKATLKSA